MKGQIWTRHRAPSGASGVILVYAPDRTRIVEARLEGEDPPQASKGNQIELKLPVPEEPVERTWSILVDYEGDVPLLVDLGWVVDPDAALPEETRFVQTPPWVAELRKASWDDSPEVVRALMLGPGRDLLPVSYLSSKSELKAFRSRNSVPPGQGLVERIRSVRRMARVQGFFLRLEEESGGTVGRRRTECVEEVDDILLSCLELRILTSREGKRGHAPHFPMLDPEEIAAVEEVGFFFKRLIEDELGRDPETIDWAFEQFATDRAAVHFLDLGLQHKLQRSGTPNGSNFFKFVELAFLMLEVAKGTERRFWLRLIPGLVRAAHVFVEHVGARKDKQRDLTMPETFAYVPRRTFDRRRVEKIRKKYARKIGAPGNEDRARWSEDVYGKHLKALSPGTPGKAAPSELGRKLGKLEISIKWAASRPSPP